jgi:hypothetical protein
MVATAQAPDWHWTASMGWPGLRVPNSYFTARQLRPTIDGGGLVAVNLIGSMRFLPQEDTLTSQDTENDGILIKYSATGNREWALHLKGADADGIFDVETDPQGNIIIAGFRSRTFHFTPTDSLVGMGPYVAKYTATGIFIQAFSFGTGRAYPDRLHISPTGDYTIEGEFSGGPSVGSFQLTPASYGNHYIAHVSASGAVTSVRHFYGSGTFGPEIRSSAMLANGNVVVSGIYTNYVQLAPGQRVTSTTQTNFVVCYRPNGTVRWARNLPLATTVAAGPTGQLYLAGSFSGTLALDTLHATSLDANDLFVAELDSATGTAQRLAYSGGGNGSQYGVALSFSPAGLPTLSFQNTAATQLGAVSLPAPQLQMRQYGALQFTAGWQPLRAFTTESQLAQAIFPLVAVDPLNQPYMLAMPASVQHFGPLDVLPQGEWEIALAHVGQLLPTHPASSLQVQLYPNPARDWATVELPADERMSAATLYDALGRVCWTSVAPAPGPLRVPVAGRAPGVYVLRLRTASGQWLSRRLLVQP